MFEALAVEPVCSDHSTDANCSASHPPSLTVSWLFYQDVSDFTRKSPQEPVVFREAYCTDMKVSQGVGRTAENDLDPPPPAAQRSTYRTVT